MQQGKNEFLRSLNTVASNEKLKRDVIARFDSLSVNPQEYSAVKTVIMKEKDNIDFIRLESAIKSLSISKKTSVLLLLKYLDEIRSDSKNEIDTTVSIPNYDKKIPEGIVHLKLRDRRHLVILFLLYTMDFDCSLIRFTIEDNLIPAYSDYLKSIYVLQTQFTADRYPFKG
ncbi:MAG: hypothetical protein QM758_08180 [Armatimonas sp.]